VQWCDLDLGRFCDRLTASLLGGRSAQQLQFGINPFEIGAIDEQVHGTPAGAAIGAIHQGAKLPVAALGVRQALGDVLAAQKIELSRSRRGPQQGVQCASAALTIHSPVPSDRRRALYLERNGIKSKLHFALITCFVA